MSTEPTHTYTETLNSTPDAIVHHEAVISLSIADLYRNGGAIWPDASIQEDDTDTDTSAPESLPAILHEIERATTNAAEVVRSIRPIRPASIHRVTGSSMISALSYTPQGIRSPDGRFSLGILCIMLHSGEIIIRYNVPSYHVGLILAQKSINRSAGKYWHKHIRDTYPKISRKSPEYQERIGEVRAEFERRLAA